MDESRFLESRFLGLVHRLNSAGHWPNQQEARAEQELILREIGVRAGLVSLPQLTEEQERTILYYMRQALIAQELGDVAVKIVNRASN